MLKVDNGGPPIDDDASPKLRWVKLNVTEILEGIEELSWEQRGYYLTALFKMYARMGGLPADDHEGAKAMRCDVRFFRRLRDQIIASGKFYVEDGLLKNSRVEREISDYVREFKKRRDAALAREEKKRSPHVELQSTSVELRGDFGETSAGSPGEVSDTSSSLEANSSIKTKGATPQLYHKPTANQNQEPEPREERTPLPPKGEAREARSVLNRRVARTCFVKWQEFTKQVGLRTPRDSSFEVFGKKLVTRLFEHASDPKGEPEMLAVFDLALVNVGRSKFLRGMSTDFRADLKFMCQRESFAKVINGDYGNGAHAAEPTGEPAECEHDRQLAFLREERQRRMLDASD